MKHKNKKRRRKFLNGDKSLEIVPRNKSYTARVIGRLGNLQHTEWKKASINTMQEMLEKGVLNQSQIEKLYEDGVDIYSLVLKSRLEKLDIENDADYLEFLEIAKSNPEAIKVMNKIQNSRKRKLEKEREKLQEEELKAELRALDMNSLEGIKEFARIQKNNPKAIEILESL